MKSPMIENASYINDKQFYTDMQVLKSPAGYYVGTLYDDLEIGSFVPGSRDTDYFATRAEAEKALAEIEAGTRKTRMHP